jgi:predicted site-specific integrase-resolvase
MVRRWIREGRLKATKYGPSERGVWMISERDLERFLHNEPERRRRT